MAEVRKRETSATAIADHEDRLRRVEALASRAPDQPIAWEHPYFASVSSSTFVPTGHLELPRYDNDVLNTRQVVICDSGTSGEIRIRQEISGAVTDVASVGPGVTQEFVDFQWLHGVHLGDTYEHFIIEARRTGGTGNLTVYNPRRSLLTTSLRQPAADATGNPTVF